MKHPLALGLVGLCALWACLLWLYAPGLKGPLILDDFVPLESLLHLDGLPADWPSWVLSSSGPLGRPVAMLSFLANAKWSGAALWQWKAVNVTLHAVNAALVASVFLALVPAQAERVNRASVGLALLAASWWALHPIQVTTALYTVQRMTELAAMFSLLGTLIYVRARLHAVDAAAARAPLALVFLGMLPLAALSKENGLLLPGLLGVLEFTVLAGRGSASVQASARRWLLVFAALPVAIGGVWFTFRGGYANRPFTPGERLLTETRVLWLYVAQILLPSRARLGFAHDDIDLSTGLFAPPVTALALFSLLGLAALALRLRLRWPLLCAGWLWFLVAHSLESGIVPLDLMYEHRNYLPSVGLILGLIGQAAVSLRRVRQVLLAAAVLGLALNLWLTRGFVADWGEETRLTAMLYQLHPRSPTAAAQFAQRLAEQRAFDVAAAVLAPLPGAGPRLQRAYIACLQRGQAGEELLSADLWRDERNLSTYAVTGLVELSRRALEGSCTLPDAALRARLKEAIAMPTILGTSHGKLQMYLAQFAREDGDTVQALGLLEAVFASDPRSPVALLLACEWLLDDGRVDDATRMLARAEAAAEARQFEAMLAPIRARIVASRATP